MAVMTLQDLEQRIGIEPFSTSIHDEEKLRHNIALSIGFRVDVMSWLCKQGLPDKTVKSALPSSLASAYMHRNYLRSWRNRVNPSWELLGNATDDDEADSFGMNDSIVPSEARASKPNIEPSAAPTAEPSHVASEKWLASLFEQVNKAVNTLVQSRLDAAVIKLDPAAKDQIKALARESAQQRIDELAPPRTIQVADASKGTIVSLGLQHEKFPILLRAVQARDHRGFRLNIWLTGPTGSGKTTAAENVSKALDLPFGSDGSLDADYKVLGFRDANGNIISTQFLNIYENGGIYVADEIDNWMPSALLSLNAALANGWVSSPKGMIKRHADACVIACANTWGMGATGEYVGRARLDAASLDRFQPKIDWPYDERMERAIAQNMDATLGIGWWAIVSNAREAAKTNGLKVIISPRATFNGISLLQQGFEHNEVIDMTFASGISPEQKKQLGISSEKPDYASTSSDAYKAYVRTRS